MAHIATGASAHATTTPTPTTGPMGLGAICARLDAAGAFTLRDPATGVGRLRSLRSDINHHIDAIGNTADELEAQACALEFLAHDAMACLGLSEWQCAALRGLLLPMSQRAQANAKALSSAISTDAPAI